MISAGTARAGARGRRHRPSRGGRSREFRRESHQFRSDRSQDLRLGISRTLVRTGGRGAQVPAIPAVRQAGRRAFRSSGRGSNRGSGARESAILSIMSVMSDNATLSDIDCESTSPAVCGGQSWPKAPPRVSLSACSTALIRRESKAFRPPRRPPSRPGRGRRTRRKATPKRRFSPARRFPASTRSSAKTRPGPAFSASAWRLRAAAAGVLRAGRTEDEAALRDAFHLTRPGADPGPAGRRLIAWRELRRPLGRAVAVLDRRRRRGSGGAK